VLKLENITLVNKEREAEYLRYQSSLAGLRWSETLTRHLRLGDMPGYFHLRLTALGWVVRVRRLIPPCVRRHIDFHIRSI
jgi:hypothetical protein